VAEEQPLSVGVHILLEELGLVHVEAKVLKHIRLPVLLAILYTVSLKTSYP
jgi:hypothetical protein